MANQPSLSSFPATQQDISQLKQTATDAVSDLGNTSVFYAGRMKGQIKNLAGDFQREGSEQLGQAKGQLTSVLSSVRDYAVARPLACIGVALCIGIVIGMSRRVSRD
jgi:ElaB/YqjD/DUF883 family membrane-anchored ribosome-binding protein